MTPIRRQRRKLPKRSDPPKPVKTAIVTMPTKKDRFKAGARDNCDICSAKIGTKLPRGKKVEIFTFTVKGAHGRLFNRCRRHLGSKVK